MISAISRTTDSASSDWQFERVRRAVSDRAAAIG